MHSTVLAVETIRLGSFKFTGGDTLINLVAAGTNALNGAILARRPDHFRNFTIVGVLLMAVLGGIGGGVARDLLVGQLPPDAFTNSSFLVLCVLAGIAGYLLAYDKGQLFREGLFQFATSFSLPWYAIVATQTGIEHGLPVVATLALAVVGPTTGRYLIDITSGVPPKQFVRGEWFVGTAVITGAVWILLNNADAPDWTCAAGAFLLGFGFRVAALYRGWEEPLASVPKGVRTHDDGRPLLGRKLHKRSRRELRDLGLLVEAGDEDGSA
jgi:uncharacterized membrane protein YeiH